MNVSLSFSLHGIRASYQVSTGIAYPDILFPPILGLDRVHICLPPAHEYHRQSPMVITPYAYDDWSRFLLQFTATLPLEIMLISASFDVSSIRPTQARQLFLDGVDWSAWLSLITGFYQLERVEIKWRLGCIPDTAVNFFFTKIAKICTSRGLTYSMYSFHNSIVSF